MRKRTTAALATLLGIVAWSITLSASSFCTIEVQVLALEVAGFSPDAFLVPLPEVTVELEVSGEGRTISAVTDSSGNARLLLVPPGAHRVTIHQPYFHPEQSTVFAFAGSTVRGRAQLMPNQYCCPLVPGIQWERADADRINPILRFSEERLRHQ